MKNSECVSIIVPIYNAEKYLSRCIDSLVNQTKKELEIILINDGSTDNSDKIIKKYNDKRIKYFKNKNQGIGKTRNFGISKSTGRYLMFIDSDDYLEKNACEILYNKIDNENLDMVICNFYRETDDGQKNKEEMQYFSNTTLKQNPEIINIINMAPWNKIYRTEIIKKNKIEFNQKLKYEDTPFVFMALDKSKKIGKVNECLNHYIVHTNSETTVRDKKIFDILEIIKIVRKYFNTKEYIIDELNKWTVRNITNYTVQQRVQQDKKTGDKFIDAAFDYLKKEIPDYKNNKYYKGRGIRRIIEKSKLLTKIYCMIYRINK